MCVKVEERIKESRGDSVNHVKNIKKKNFSKSPQSKKGYSHDSKASSSKGQDKAPMKEYDHVPKGVCRHCKRGTLHDGLCRVSQVVEYVW
jgi:hypothetical protein